MKPILQRILNESTDGWSQTQKEALIDLCLLGMYSDNKISLAEQDFIEDESEQLHWKSGISFSGYLQRTIPKIRSAKDNSQQVQEMLRNICERLGSDECKQKSIDELKKLLATDEVVQLEEEFLLEVQSAMGI